MSLNSWFAQLKRSPVISGTLLRSNFTGILNEHSSCKRFEHRPSVRDRHIPRYETMGIKGVSQQRRDLVAGRVVREQHQPEVDPGQDDHDQGDAGDHSIKKFQFCLGNSYV